LFGQQHQRTAEVSRPKSQQAAEARDGARRTDNGRHRGEVTKGTPPPSRHTAGPRPSESNAHGSISGLAWRVFTACPARRQSACNPDTYCSSNKLTRGGGGAHRRSWGLVQPPRPPCPLFDPRPPSAAVLYRHDVPRGPRETGARGRGPRRCAAVGGRLREVFEGPRPMVDPTSARLSPRGRAALSRPTAGPPVVRATAPRASPTTSTLEPSGQASPRGGCGWSGLDPAGRALGRAT